jgi:hypothetical protein
LEESNQRNWSVRWKNRKALRLGERRQKNGVQWERGKSNGKAMKEIDKALAKKNTTPKRSEHSDELGQKMKLDRKKTGRRKSGLPWWRRRVLGEERSPNPSAAETEPGRASLHN